MYRRHRPITAGKSNLNKNQNQFQRCLTNSSWQATLTNLQWKR